MEELYSSVIEGGRIHSVDWSSLNLLALSISLTKNGYVGEGFGSSKTHQLLVVDANRPWEYHVVYGDNKTVSVNVKWSLSGMLLLSVEQDSVARVWRMKDNCINTWSRIHKIQLKENDKLLHSSWVEYQPLPNININKEAWPELLEYHPHSSYLHSIVPEATVFVYESGLVQLVSFSDKDQDVSVYDAQLEVEGSLWTSRTLAASDGTVLCVVVCNDGLVKLFVLKLSLNSESSLSLTASLATSFHPTGGGGGQLTDLIVHPDTGGCLLHICYDKTNLLQWSLRDITQSGNYMFIDEHLAVINVSPIEANHFLLVPNPKDCLPQVITQDSLLLCLQLMSLCERNDTCVVANSLLAYASVNHLHYHFISISYPLLAHRLDGKVLVDGVYELTNHPMKGFRFQCKDNKNNEELSKTASDVYGVIKILLAKDIPHNLFILKRSSFNAKEDKKEERSNEYISIILMPRKPAYGVKTLYEDRCDHLMPPFFVAACEIGGFVPIIDQIKYPIIKEEEIVSEMKQKSISNEEYKEIITLLAK